MKVYIEYKERRSGGEELDPSGMWSSRSDTHIDYELVGAYFQKPEGSWYIEQFDIECEETPKDIYVVVVRYQGGDTFGTSYGNGCIEGVYLNEDDALKVVESIENDTYKKGYARWEGYFNRLESANCFVLSLNKDKKSSKKAIRIN